MPGRERDDQIVLNDRQWGCRHDQAAIRLARERCDGALDFAGVAHADRTQRNSTPNAAITPRNRGELAHAGRDGRIAKHRRLLHTRRDLLE